MAASGLALQLSDYRTFACDELFGGSAGYAGLDTGEKSEIDRLILRGERTLWLHPPVDPPHVWSCLRDPGLIDVWGDIPLSTATPLVTVTQSGGTMTATAASFYRTMIGKAVVVTSQATYTVTGYTSSTVVTVTPTATYATARTFSIASNGVFPLPSDFESPESSTMTFTGVSWTPDVQLVNEKIVTGLRATQAQTGYPQYASIRWVVSDGSAAQSQEVVMWPEPDVHYEMSLPYVVQPQGMSTDNPYPRGGPEMADCLLSVILAVCQESKSGQRGDRWAEAVQKCGVAAKRDRTRHHNFYAGRMAADASANPRVLDVKQLVLPA